MAGAATMPMGSLYSAYTQPQPPPPAPAPAPSGGAPPPLQISAPVTFSGGSTDYTTAYNQALQTNQQMYNNILGGYNSTMAYQQSQSQAIAQGYDTLQADTLGQLAGVQTAANQQAADQYAQQVGTQTQQMVDRGLGNSTVTNSVARGLQYDYSKVLGQNAANFGQLNAQYQSQIGLAGLGYQGQALNDTTQLANQQLQFMNSVTVPYPDPYAYAALNQQAGAVSAGGYGGVSSPTGYGSYGGASGSGKPPNTMNPSMGNQGSYYTSPSYGGTSGYYAPPQTGGSQTLYPSGSQYQDPDWASLESPYNEPAMKQVASVEDYGTGIDTTPNTGWEDETYSW